MLVLKNANCFPGRNGYQPKYIILHGTAGGSNAEAIANYFASTQGTSNPVSSHYVIGQDGEVVQCVSESDGAWANGVLTAGHDSWWGSSINPNNITISIEHCNPAQDNSTPLTDAQKQASFALIKDICNRWDIPCKGADADGGITGHFSIDPINRRNCPGNYPWDELWTFLQGEQRIMIDGKDVASFFVQAGNNWKCVNGFIIMGAILDFYRSFGNSGLCGLTYLGLPLSNEIIINTVPGHPEITIQKFERGLVAYDPAHKLDNVPGAGDVYLLHIPDLQAQIDKLTKDNAALQSQLQQAQQSAPHALDMANVLKQIAALSKPYGASNT